MKWSYYNFDIKYGNKTIIYNTLTSAIISFEDESGDIITSLKQNNFQSIFDDNIEKLKTNKFIVNDDDERNTVNNYRFKNNFINFNKSDLSLTIASTEACNCACPYCFETQKKNVSMTKEIADNLIKFIQNHKSSKSYSLRWYGGEPLLNFNIIKYFLSETQKLNKSFNSHTMVTNGYLLDKEKALFFKEYPLERIQVSIDGDEETHNKSRYLKNGKGTFSTILNNVEQFAKINPDTKISLRINLTLDNISSFPSLYQLLKDRFYQYNVSIYTSFIHGDSESVVPYKDQFDFYLNLYKNHNIPVNFLNTKHTQIPCTATMISSFTVGADGNLYKCWEDIGKDKYKIGHISNNNINQNLLTEYYFRNRYEDSECAQCAFLPICSWSCSKQKKPSKEYCQNKANYFGLYLKEQIKSATHKSKKQWFIKSSL